jgi:hypothetical protein
MTPFAREALARLDCPSLMRSNLLKEINMTKQQTNLRSGLAPFFAGVIGATIALNTAWAETAPAASSSTPAPAGATSTQSTLASEKRMLALEKDTPTLWKVGIMDTWLKGGVGGMGYGGSLKVERDLCRYADLGFRVGYMKWDCRKVAHVPLELTATVKYPLFNDRLVPYVGVGGGYNVWTAGQVSLDNCFSVFPTVGLEWRLSPKKQWSIFIEARAQFMATEVTPSESSNQPGAGSCLETWPRGTKHPQFDSWGGSFGLIHYF